MEVLGKLPTFVDQQGHRTANPKDRSMKEPKSHSKQGQGWRTFKRTSANVVSKEAPWTKRVSHKACSKHVLETII